MNDLAGVNFEQAEVPSFLDSFKPPMDIQLEITIEEMSLLFSRCQAVCRHYQNANNDQNGQF